MNQKNKGIMKEYLQGYNDYVLLGDVVYNALQDIVKQTGIKVLAIQHRIKAEERLAGKLERKGDKYHSLADIMDIVGTRIVCFFADDIDRLGPAIRSVFEIDYENSIDKREQLDPNSFGYVALHYICWLPQGKQYPDAICGKRFEIQICSALQHTWSVIQHEMGYKSEFDVPRQIVRDYSRLAGLLELADERFVAIRSFMNNYSAEVKNKIAENEGGELKIDMVTLREYMNHNKGMRRLLDEICAICGAELTSFNPEMYVSQLSWLGKTTLGGLYEMLENNYDTAVKLARLSLEGTDLDIVSSTVGLRLLCQAELLRQNCSEGQITEFMTLVSGNRERAQRQAAALLHSAAELQ
ncbi:MAG: hypothetical protein RR049_03915 [Angelakisella sp.]